MRDGGGVEEEETCVKGVFIKRSFFLFTFLFLFLFLLFFFFFFPTGGGGRVLSPSYRNSILEPAERHTDSSLKIALGKR